jgi:geranylgeranyl diphosphate synthase type I
MPATVGFESLSGYKTEINAALERFFQSVPEHLNADISPLGEAALQRLQAYCLRPGKRLRGSLAAFTFDNAAGAAHADAGIQLGVVLELMQSYLLIVDDVMDRSALRRGEPTMHEMYKSDGVKEQTADMAAINVGLLAQHFASLVMSKIEAPAKALNDASAILQRNIALTGFGQLDDLLTAHGPEVKDADIIRKYTLKSSYYTFVNPLQLGFALAGQSNPEVQAVCEKFGIAAGIAFQLHDDYLGMFGSSDDTGKSTLDDLREGKYTLLMHFALEHAAAKDIELLRRILGNPTANEADLGHVQQILRDSGAKKLCEAETLKHAEAAKHVLSESEIGTDFFRDVLAAIVDYCVTRKQ